MSNKDDQALKLFSAAVPLAKIRDTLKFRSTSSAHAAVIRAMKKQQQASRTSSSTDLELIRLDTMYQSLYPRAVNGEIAAIDRCLKIGEARIRLSSDKGTKGELVAAYEASIAALPGIEADGLDRAVIEAGRAVAQQIDYQVTFGSGQDVTKALYLLPHLMNVLRELGATPAARHAVQAAVPAPDTQEQNPIASLDAFRTANFGK